MATAAFPAFETPDAAFPKSTILGMPGLRKAAILMVAVGDELAKMFFQGLSAGDVQQVADEITRLGEIPRSQVTQVLLEFYRLLETEQYTVRGGSEYASRLLGKA